MMKTEKESTGVAADVTFEMFHWCVRIMHCSGVQPLDLLNTLPVG